jgi:methylase of polypeptide subunit release factors
MMTDLFVTCGTVTISYPPDLDAGGSVLWRNYVDFVKEYIGPVPRVLEWCAGPGFFGFSLLASSLCESVCFVDINPKAIEACRATAERNHLEDRISGYVSDGLNALPSSESFDLVIANPPHSGTADCYPEWGSPLIYMDTNWAIHRQFYRTVGRFLKSGADVILLENSELSNCDTFREMIEQGGLQLIGTSPCRIKLPGYAETYLIWSKKEALAS